MLQDIVSPFSYRLLCKVVNRYLWVEDVEIFYLILESSHIFTLGLVVSSLFEISIVVLALKVEFRT